MTFLQPFIFLALPLVLLPVVIHLLNRLRYRTREWAAIMFLIALNRSSTRHARLREFLILLMRCLALAALLATLSRPLVGGWLGMALATAPDTIMILLDRSASMEAYDGQRQITRREQALKLLAHAAQEYASASRLVVLDSAGGDAREIGDPAVLAQLEFTRPTDTAASLPALLQRALDYIVENRTGRTELWLASDLQRSSWDPDNSRWADLSAQLAQLPQKVSVRLLALNWPVPPNQAIRVQDVSRLRTADGYALQLVIDISRSATGEATVPLTISINGAISQRDLPLVSQFSRLTEQVRIPAEAGGWGALSLPSDGNARDNTAYFVYGKEQALRTVVVSPDDAAARMLKFAAAPAPEALRQQADIVGTPAATRIAWDQVALLLWKDDAPPADIAESAGAFVEAGGVAVVFPTGTPGSSPFLGIRWNEVVEATPDTAALTVAAWNEQDGPLANVSSGTALPLANLALTRHQRMSVQEGGIIVARLSNGDPFLVRRTTGRGTVYACASLPDKAWSSLGDGPVLVPMLQRMLREGGRRLAPAQTADCGAWPLAATPGWRPVDADDRRAEWDAGVYERDGEFAALNRPVAEDAPELVETADARALFGRLPVRVWEETTQASGANLQTEIWRIFLVAMLVFLAAESLLVLPRTPAQRGTREAERARGARAA